MEILDVMQRFARNGAISSSFERSTISTVGSFQRIVGLLASLYSI